METRGGRQEKILKEKVLARKSPCNISLSFPIFLDECLLTWHEFLGISLYKLVRNVVTLQLSILVSPRQQSHVMVLKKLVTCIEVDTVWGTRWENIAISILHHSEFWCKPGAPPIIFTFLVETITLSLIINNFGTYIHVQPVILWM